MMMGFAQNLLLERGHSFLLKETAVAGSWPVLESCVRLKLLPYVDFAMAQALLKGHSGASEGLAALLCHLSFSSRQGHLCVSIAQDLVDPDPRLLWLVGDEESPAVLTQETSDLLEALHKLVVQGANETTHVEAVRREDSLFYLQKFWAYEELFIDSLRRLLEEPPQPQFDATTMAAETNRMVAEGLLLPAQAKGVQAAGLHRLTLLTGGPGTGKTYTAGHMIRLVWESLDSSAKQSFEIAVAAPTGKAAANLEASLSRSTGSIEGFPTIKARTLHSLLGFKGPKTPFDPEKKLSADLVLVDESSMIDIRLMAYLLASIKPGGRLVLLGDRHQLPSVDAGGLFSDLIELFEARRQPSLVELSTCVRAENQVLVDFADAVKRGHVSDAADILNNGHSDAVKRLHFAEQTLQIQLLEYARPYFQRMMTADHAALLKNMNSFRLLCPLRQGPCGVDALNELFAKALGEAVMPIMLTQNDYRLDLYNGEAGMLVRDPAGDYALFAGRIPGHPERRFPAILLPKYERAYCISVHKSQGSEFDHVLMLVPRGAEVFGREVFYTAATRARRRLDVWGEDSVINKTLANRSYRLSGIQHKLRP